MRIQIFLQFLRRIISYDHGGAGWCFELSDIYSRITYSNTKYWVTSKNKIAPKYIAIYMMTESIDYNTDLEQLLKLHAEECESLSILHRNSYEKYNGRSNYINIPVIILSSAIGFATGIDIGYANMNIILGVSSIFVGIIKSIDTYFQLGKRAETHRLCSLQFQQINKKIQIELALVRSQRVDAKDMMNIIKTDIKNLFDIAPLIDQDVIEAFQKKYGHQVVGTPGKYTFDAHTPNLCNGLSIVTVNSARNKQDYEERSSRKSSRDGSPARDNNHDAGGVTVVIDDATIAQEIQQRIQQSQQSQQPQSHQPQSHQPQSHQPQSHQPQSHYNHIHMNQLQQTPVTIEFNPYHASADLVSLHSTRASSVNRSVPHTPRAPLNAIVTSVNSIANPIVSVRESVNPSVRESVNPSVRGSVNPSVRESVNPSVRESVNPSVRESAAITAVASATQSIHGDSSPPIQMDVHDVPTNATPHVDHDTMTTLQLTQEQLQQLLLMQQQMLQDIEGQDGEMM